MAVKGEKAEDKLREITECSICISAYTDPRMLSCIHTFRFECLKHTAEATQKKPGDKMPCPLCRKEVVIPEDGINGIQKNFFIENRLEYKTMLQMGSNAIICDICNITNEGKAGHIPEAIMRCSECKEHYCDGCVKVHQFQKATKDHHMVVIGRDMKSERHLITSTKTCTKHIQKLLDYYCADCKKIVCVSCFNESHSSHKCCDVTSVNEEFHQMIEAKSSKILTYMNEILFIRNKNEKRKSDFLKEIAEREKEIHKRNKELKAMTKRHTKLLFEELSVVKSQHLKELETEIEEIDRHCSIFESFESYCTELALKRSTSDICSSVDELIARADDLERDHESFLFRPRKSVEVSFHATDLGDVLHNANSNFVGHVEAKVEALTLYENFAVALVLNYSDKNMNIVRINLHQPNDITTLERIPTTLMTKIVVAVYNNTMYFAGIGATCNEIWKYNQTSGWLKCASLVQGRVYHSAAFIDEVLFICGGFTYSSKLVVDSVEAFNAVTNKCTAVGKLVHAVHSTGNCVPYKSSLYIFGGADKDGSDVRHVQEYNTKENTCTLVLRSMPRPDRLMRGILSEKSVILLGESTCFLFNIETETWQEREQFKTDYPHFGLVLENKRLFVIGRYEFEWKRSDDVRYVPLQNIIDNKVIAWKSHGKLPKPSPVYACAIMRFPT